MSVGTVLAIVGALLLHALVLLFGGLVFPTCRPEGEGVQEVELIGAEDPSTPAEKQEPERPEEQPEPIESESDEPPDATEIMKSLDVPSPADAPELEAASLGAIEQALSGLTSAGGDFGDALSFASGGRIGGTGRAGGADGEAPAEFDLSGVQQEARAIYRASPVYPAELRGKKIEGLVEVICIVDATGKVADARVKRTNHPAFEKPALDAARQWKFEPAVRRGQRDTSHVTVPFRFPPS